MGRFSKKLNQKKCDNRWFKSGKGAQIYYSPFPKYLYEINVAGTGDKPATPNEMSTLLNNLLSKENVSVHSIKRFESVFITDDSKKEPGVQLPPGTYKYVYDQFSGAQKLIPMSFRDDHYVKLSNVNEQFIKDFNDFVQSEKLYKDLNTIYKEGFLCFGPPGGGKTATIRNLVSQVIPKDAVAITIDKDLPTTEFIEAMRETLGNRLKIIIFEEFTNFTKDPYDMNEILSFIDGESSLDKSVIIATTNYPEALPGNIVERPSRFDKFYEFDNPGAGERKLLLTHYLMRECTEQEVTDTKDMSIAAIKEVCLLSHKRKVTVLDAISSIKKQLALAKKNFQKSGKIGL